MKVYKKVNSFWTYIKIFTSILITNPIHYFKVLSLIVKNNLLLKQTFYKYLLASFVILLAYTASATFYYGRSFGNNTNEGTSESSLWCSIVKVSDYTSNQGVQIIFKRGNELNSAITVTASEATGNPTIYYAPSNVPETSKWFYICNKLESLDSAGEWYYVNATITVNLWAQNSDNPANYKVIGSTIENRITKMIMAYHFDSKYQFYQGYNFLKIKELFSPQHMVQNLASSFSIFTKCLYEIQLFWTLLKIYTCLF